MLSHVVPRKSCEISCHLLVVPMSSPAIFFKKKTFHLKSTAVYNSSAKIINKYLEIY